MHNLYLTISAVPKWQILILENQFDEVFQRTTAESLMNTPDFRGGDATEGNPVLLMTSLIYWSLSLLPILSS